MLATFSYLQIIIDQIYSGGFNVQRIKNMYFRSLVFVSTLDGKLTALDLANNGEIKWSLEFGEGPMLSSNIHQRKVTIEMTIAFEIVSLYYIISIFQLDNDAHWVKLIPSLSGGLYKFDGDNLEAVPISIDQLLRSPFHYSHDLVLSGGKETLSYGKFLLNKH